MNGPLRHAHSPLRGVSNHRTLLGALLLALVVGGNPGLWADDDVPVDSDSVKPGTEVLRGAVAMKLAGTPIEIGQRIPSISLKNTGMADMDLAELAKEKVLLISIVPSVDTKVCERQTHILGEEGDKLPAEVQRIALSRDLPFAQKRFGEEAELMDLLYLSDFKGGEFGLATGLLMEDLGLLARAVIVVNKGGVVRYIQVVPQIGHLPDMEKAFAEAEAAAVESRAASPEKAE